MRTARTSTSRTTPATARARSARRCGTRADGGRDDARGRRGAGIGHHRDGAAQSGHGELPGGDRLPHQSAPARAFTEDGYRNHIAEALAEAIREHVGPRAIASELGAGDGSPFVAEALKGCWEACEQLRLGASAAGAPNVAAARRVRTETGVAVDVNPYAGIGRNEIEAVIRAGFSSRALPEVPPRLVGEGRQHAVGDRAGRDRPGDDRRERPRDLPRKVYFEDLGADYFLVTTRAGSGTDNVFRRQRRRRRWARDALRPEGGGPRDGTFSVREHRRRDQRRADRFESGADGGPCCRRRASTPCRCCWSTRCGPGSRPRRRRCCRSSAIR